MKRYKITFIVILFLLFSAYVYAGNFPGWNYCNYLMENDDLTKFHIAVCKGDMKALKELIGKGININQSYFVNAKTWEGNHRFEFTALHTALLQYVEFNSDKENYKQIIQLLVKHGINAEAPYRYWYSKNTDTPPKELSERRPIDMAPNYEIAQLLKEGGAKMSPLILLKQKGSFNYFQGEIIVSGTIEIDPYHEIIPGMLCMHVDRNTFHLIPRIGDSRSAWFCFEDNTNVISKLKINSKKIKDKCFSGIAKIKITNYRQYIGESEDVDLAKLIAVFEMKDYSYKECSSQQ